MSEPSQPTLPAGAVAALSIAAFGSGMSMRVNDPLLPLMARVFDVGLGRVALVISLFAIAYGTALLVIGPLGEKYGKYRVVAVGTALCAATALGCGLAWDFTSLLVARIAAGLTAGAIIPLSMAWIGDVIGYERRQSVLARFLIGQILGTSAGAWVGGLAADAQSWRAPYFGIALLFGFSAVLLWTRLQRLPASARVAQPQLRLHPITVAEQMGHVLRVQWARRILALVALEGGFVYGAVAFIPTHLHQALGLSLASAGSLVMLFGFGGFAFALGSSRLVAALREPGLVRAGGALMTAALLLVAFSRWVPASALSCFMLGAGFYMLHNTLQVNATQMAPERRSVAVALFAAAFFLGQALGVQAVGMAASAIGTVTVLSACALAVAAVAAAVWLALSQHRAASAVAAGG
jgi:predicted MFS family arabinose efflux permease